MILIAVLGFWFIIPVACAIVASSKGRSGVLWFVVGLFLNIIALIMVAGMPALYEPSTQAGIPRIKGQGDKNTIFSLPGLLLLLTLALILALNHKKADTPEIASPEIWNPAPDTKTSKSQQSGGSTVYR